MRYLLLSLVLLFCSCWGGKSESKGSAQVVNSLLEVELPAAFDAVADTMHLGLLREGEIISGSFTLSNKGSEPYVIGDVTTTCGCTDVEYDRKPIVAGESSVVKFTFNSSGKFGAQIQYFSLIFAGGERLRVFFDADVETK